LCWSKTYVNDIKRLRYSEEHYFKSDSEMTELFSDLPEAIENNKNLFLDATTDL